ncbi:MAG: hypothetical protein OXU36_18750 [Candidatus Poribacteria bacterium]|nr:hypothetical protein [Candidatus Poribacteria bacterium]
MLQICLFICLVYHKPQWEEESSQDFIDYGKYFVPDREIQIDCICVDVFWMKAGHAIFGGRKPNPEVK